MDVSSTLGLPFAHARELNPFGLTSGGAGVISLSIDPAAAAACAEFLLTRWTRDGLAFGGGGGVCRGFSLYPKTLGDHDARRQQGSTLLVPAPALEALRTACPAFATESEAAGAARPTEPAVRRVPQLRVSPAGRTGPPLALGRRHAHGLCGARGGGRRALRGGGRVGCVRRGLVSRGPRDVLLVPLRARPSTRLECVVMRLSRLYDVEHASHHSGVVTVERKHFDSIGQTTDVESRSQIINVC